MPVFGWEYFLWHYDKGLHLPLALAHTHAVVVTSGWTHIGKDNNSLSGLSREITLKKVLSILKFEMISKSRFSRFFPVEPPHIVAGRQRPAFFLLDR
jgi:hypothetical protein